MANTSSRIAGLRSLLVDDMRDMRANLRNQLDQLGMAKVDQAKNAAEALKLVSSNKYDLVLCDYNLGDETNGQQLLEFLKARRLLPASTIFFMVTAESKYPSVVTAGEFAPDDYLIKPFTASICNRLSGISRNRMRLRLSPGGLAQRPEWRHRGMRAPDRRAIEVLRGGLRLKA